MIPLRPEHTNALWPTALLLLIAGHLASPGPLCASEASWPFAEMRATVIAAAEVEPASHGQRLLLPEARRDLLRQVVQVELAREQQRGAAPGSHAPELRHTDATGRETVNASRDEAARAQGAARGRKVANERGEETGAAKPERPGRLELLGLAAREHRPLGP